EGDCRREPKRCAQIEYLELIAMAKVIRHIHANWARSVEGEAAFGVWRIYTGVPSEKRPSTSDCDWWIVAAGTVYFSVRACIGHRRGNAQNNCQDERETQVSGIH